MAYVFDTERRFQFRAAARRFGDPPVHLNSRTAADGSFEFADLPADVKFELRAYGIRDGDRTLTYWMQPAGWVRTHENRDSARQVRNDQAAPFELIAAVID